MMLVKNLIEALKGLPEDSEVWVARCDWRSIDAESCEPLKDVAVVRSFKDKTACLVHLLTEEG